MINTNKEAVKKMEDCARKFEQLAEEFHKRGFNIVWQATIHLETKESDCIYTGVGSSMSVPVGVAQQMMLDHGDTLVDYNSKMVNQIIESGVLDNHGFDSAGDA